MSLIPRRLVYRVLAQVVHGEARVVAGRTVDQADELTRRSHNSIYSEGDGVDPALLGWLVALALGHTEARAEIARFADHYAIESVDWSNMPQLLDRILPREREEGSPIYD